MQTDEVNRRLWESAALKLLKGKPLSSLTKVALSGLKTEVLYKDRPAGYRTSMRQLSSWDAVEMQGRVAGRFDGASKWVEGKSPILTRVYTEECTSAIQSQRVAPVDAGLKDLMRLSQSGIQGVIHIDPYAVLLQESSSNDAMKSTFDEVLERLQTQDGAHSITVDASVVDDMLCSHVTS